MHRVTGKRNQCHSKFVRRGTSGQGIDAPRDYLRRKNRASQIRAAGAASNDLGMNAARYWSAKTQPLKIRVDAASSAQDECTCDWPKSLSSTIGLAWVRPWIDAPRDWPKRKKTEPSLFSCILAAQSAARMNAPLLEIKNKPPNSCARQRKCCQG
jgi:hypothetical protein